MKGECGAPLSRAGHSTPIDEPIVDPVGSCNPGDGDGGLHDDELAATVGVRELRLEDGDGGGVESAAGHRRVEENKVIGREWPRESSATLGGSTSDRQLSSPIELGAELTQFRDR